MKEVVLICKNSEISRIIYNTLKVEKLNITVIVERKETLINIFRKRLKKYGILISLSQGFFYIMYFILKKISFKRILEIKKSYKISFKKIPTSKLYYIKNINSKVLIEYVNKIKPNLVIINGTRILKNNTIENILCPIINIHMGITPKYRGVHGGYWALVNQDKNKFGVTIHRVDKGIDTGEVIAQKVLNISRNDNISTYPYLQAAAAMKLLKDIIEKDIKANHSNIRNLKIYKIWHHPTIIEYIVNRFNRKVK